MANTKLKHGNSTDELQARISGLKDQGGVSDLQEYPERKQIDFEGDLSDVDEADVVPSGVAEISRLQGMGYTYVRP